MNKFGLIGNNISYSLSPKLHHIIADKTNYKLSYELIDIKEEEISKYLNLLKEKEFTGFNVTIPYKETIIKYLDVISPRASKIKAVNTIYLNKDGKLVGDNTDYYGFSELLKTNNVLKDIKKAYILGTGGAAKTVFHVLTDNDIETVNVTRDINNTTGFKNLITYEDFKKIKEVDLVVNCTPVGSILNKGIPIHRSKQTIKKVVDLIYNPLNTELMDLGLESYNGIIMLIYQAIKAQAIWKKEDFKIQKD